VLTVVWGAGLFYFLDYRRDAIGYKMRGRLSHHVAHRESRATAI
jgi:hypothetical protein